MKKSHRRPGTKERKSPWSSRMAGPYGLGDTNIKYQQLCVYCSMCECFQGLCSLTFRCPLLHLSHAPILRIFLVSSRC